MLYKWQERTSLSDWTFFFLFWQVNLHLDKLVLSVFLYKYLLYTFSCCLMFSCCSTNFVKADKFKHVLSQTKIIWTELMLSWYAQWTWEVKMQISYLNYIFLKIWDLEFSFSLTLDQHVVHNFFFIKVSYDVLIIFMHVCMYVCTIIAIVLNIPKWYTKLIYEIIIFK